MTFLLNLLKIFLIVAGILLVMVVILVLFTIIINMVSHIVLTLFDKKDDDC